MGRNRVGLRVKIGLGLGKIRFDVMVGSGLALGLGLQRIWVDIKVGLGLEKITFGFQIGEN